MANHQPNALAASSRTTIDSKGDSHAEAPALPPSGRVARAGYARLRDARRCGSTPAEPVPFTAVPADRIVQPGYTEPGTGLVAVDVRRERSRDVIVRFRDAVVYVDGEQVTDLMKGEHVVFYLSPGVHRIGVSTQFDPVVQMRFTVTADTRYTNRASITFGEDHRIALRRVAR